MSNVESLTKVSDYSCLLIQRYRPHTYDSLREYLNLITAFFPSLILQLPVYEVGYFLWFCGFAFLHAIFYPADCQPLSHH